MKSENKKHFATWRLCVLHTEAQRHRDILNTENTEQTKFFRSFRDFRVQKKIRPQIFGILGILITSASEIIPLICAIRVQE